MQIEDLFTLVLFVFACKFDQICSLTNENTCTPTSAGNSSIDDVPAINSALLTCGNGGTIIISSNTIFMIRSPLDFANCRQCSFQIEGTLKNITGATIQSLTGMGIIDGSGQVNASNITFNNIKLKDAPMIAVSTSVNDPKNTDGFDIGECSHVTLNNIHVTNGDDCVAFENGANYITVNNITCVGSHGVSVGSLGLGAGETYVVQNVYVSKIKMINCSKAAGIKLWPGGSSHGSVFVTNVTYDGVIVDNCDYAFQIMNCYESESKTCEKHPSTARLSRIHLMNFTGKTSRKYEPHVANIDCPPNGTCDLTFTGWDIIAPHRKSVVLCAHYDHPSGVKCTPGAFG
ncbi:unnamed protein product [Adineta ricciae]|uniref:Uncharacterized protein n=1 Tax=Adineta ricciae TaxID=249248 RepID=A0A815MG01_ADIRI|nr:unnamed protein product [Adineta ricciae]